MKLVQLIFFLLIVVEAESRGEASVWVKDETTACRLGFLSKPESVGEVLVRAGGFSATKSEVAAYESGKIIPHLRISWIHRSELIQFPLHRGEARLWNSQIAEGDMIEVKRGSFSWGAILPEKIIPSNTKAESGPRE